MATMASNLLGWSDLLLSPALASSGAIGRRCVENCGPGPAVWIGGVVGLVVAFAMLRKRAGGKTGAFSLRAFQERIDLHLSLMGKETVRLNGEWVAEKWKWSVKSEHRIRLSDGREAVLGVAGAAADGEKKKPSKLITVFAGLFILMPIATASSVIHARRSSSSLSKTRRLCFCRSSFRFPPFHSNAQ